MLTLLYYTYNILAITPSKYVYYSSLCISTSDEDAPRLSGLLLLGRTRSTISRILMAQLGSLTASVAKSEDNREMYWHFLEVGDLAVRYMIRSLKP
jgi:hypothetical protein